MFSLFIVFSFGYILHLWFCAVMILIILHGYCELKLARWDVSLRHDNKNMLYVYIYHKQLLFWNRYLNLLSDSRPRGVIQGAGRCISSSWIKDSVCTMVGHTTFKVCRPWTMEVTWLENAHWLAETTGNPGIPCDIINSSSYNALWGRGVSPAFWSGFSQF